MKTLLGNLDFILVVSSTATVGLMMFRDDWHGAATWLIVLLLLERRYQERRKS